VILQVVGDDRHPKKSGSRIDQAESLAIIKTAMKNSMGIDQYGTTYHNLGQFPRKELLNRLGRRRASKMYVDRKNGTPAHVGYVIGSLWITLYTITPFARVQRR
jgi:hypothetical protein